MCVTDSWKAYRHALSINDKHKKLGLVEFANLLALDCLENEYDDEDPTDRAMSIGVPRRGVCSVSSLTRNSETRNSENDDDGGFLTPRRSPRLEACGVAPPHPYRDRDHVLYKNAAKEPGTNRTKRGRCQAKGCKNKMIWHCRNCEPMGAKRSWYCRGSNHPSCHQSHKKRRAMAYDAYLKRRDQICSPASRGSSEWLSTRK